jgi:hypothetical protein
MSNKYAQFMAGLKTSLADNSFVKLTLGHYVGPEPELKTIIAKKVLIKRQEKLSFTFRFKTRDIIKNYNVAEGVVLIANYLQDDFYTANLLTTGFDLNYQNQHNKITLTKKAASITAPPLLAHDHAKTRLITAKPDKAYLQALNITDNQGQVYKHAQDKYRQINRYIEILSSLIKPQANLKIVDMGAGKGYLTFALYDYLTSVAKINAQIVGVEYRADLVDLCNKIATEAEFHQLQFVQGTIDAFDSSGTNILIALHACNTATDDAIAKGITAGANLIVVAPCCHKQIRQELEKNKTPNDLDFLMQYGIFMERQAEMLTDGLRALILNYYGYSTKVFEFISDNHTPKNVMIAATKNPQAKLADPQTLAKITAIKTYFGIGTHYLEQLMGLNAKSRSI